MPRRRPASTDFVLSRLLHLSLASLLFACAGPASRPPIDDSPLPGSAAGGAVGSDAGADGAAASSLLVPLATALDHPQGLALEPSTLLVTLAPVAANAASGSIVRLARGGPSTPATLFTAQDDPFAIAVAAAPVSTVAWTNRASMFPAGGRSSLVVTTGTDAPRPLVPAETLTTGLAIAGGVVFWTSRDVSGGILVERAPLAGGAAQTVTTLAAFADPAGIAVDGAFVYFVGSGPGASVARAPIAGGVAEVIMDDPGARLVDVLVVGNVLWVTDAAGSVFTVPKAGGAAQVVASAQTGASHLARDASRVYWTNEITEGTVAALPIVPAASDVPAVLASHLDRPSAIAVDDAIYFTTYDAVMRLAK